MNKKKNLVFFLVLILLAHCSFDDKTGIWSGDKEEKRRITELEKKQKQLIDVDKIISSDNFYTEEKKLIKKISLSKPEKNSSWEMAGLNRQNFLGNIYLSGIDNRFLKKKNWKK